MNRYLPVGFALASIAAVYACSSDSDTPVDPGTDAGVDDPAPAPPPPPPPGDLDGGMPDDAEAGEASVATDSPIEGIAAPEVVLDFAGPEFLDGPSWHSGENALFFTRPLGLNPDLRRMPPTGGASVPVRTETVQYQGPVGSTIDKNGAIVIAEGNKVVRIDVDGGAPVVLMTEADAGGAGAPVLTPNDVVARLSDNTLYVTDPGYFVTDPPTNRLYRIAPDGAASIAIDFGVNIPRPNGIAISKDEMTLFVSFTFPPQGEVPHIMKYAVNPDGTLGAAQKFTDVGAGAEPDGLAIDEAGNVYCATKTGVAVYKPDGSAKWGDIPIPQTPTPHGATGVAFGGADKKTLFITTNGGKLYSVVVKVAGLAQ